MGVKVKMVTGDQLAIAKETAKKLGMGTNILDATGLGDVKKQETAEVAESIEKADGFAQVFPAHKFHIVDVLQKRGHLVGMTGDGVNDAPALKKADCGIAVSSATDAARAAAAIVLLTPGLSVIIDAIKESRKIFQRMNSYAIYRIAETLRVLFFMTLAILVFNFYPLTAVMIVMLALLNDGAILSIAYDNVHYKDQPEGWNMRMVLGSCYGSGPYRRRVCLRFILSRRARLSSRPSTYPNADVFEIVRGWTPDDFPDAYAGSVLDHPSCEYFMGGSPGHANDSDFDCGFWVPYDTSRLEMGWFCLGLRDCMVAIRVYVSSAFRSVWSCSYNGVAQNRTSPFRPRSSEPVNSDQSRYHLLPRTCTPSNICSSDGPERDHRTRGREIVRCTATDNFKYISVWICRREVERRARRDRINRRQTRRRSGQAL